MECTAYNPQKGRLETLDIEFTEENTTWFENIKNGCDVDMIADFNGGLLIKRADYSYPIWLYDISRADINYNQKKAQQLVIEYANGQWP